MFEKLKKLLKNKEALFDGLNLLTGLTMMTALFVYGATRNEISMYLVIFTGGLMNLLNGRKLYEKKEKRNIGMSMMLLGAIVLILCLVLMLQ
ncbi:MAG: hypothetical protein ACI4FZ_05090 [Lachnospiraceae bacterium]